jgi:hypothetical protein
MRRLGPRVAEVKRRVARRIDQDADAFRRHIEGYGRVRVTGIVFRICIYANGLLLSPLREGEHLQS